MTVPVPVAGSDIAYRDVDRVIGASLERHVAQGVGSMRLEPDHAYQLQVELIEAHAEYSSERLVVRLAVRATFRRATGNVYIAQGHARCAVSELVPPDAGSSVVKRCSDSLANDLERWLSGIELH